MQDFDDKVAVITGGASGIGFATANKLGAKGANLLLADIEPDALEEAAGMLRTRHGVRVEGQVCNVAVKADMDALADFAFTEMGGAHILFNNAGVAVGGPVAEMSYDDWRWIIDVDLWGVVNGVHAFLPRIQAQDQPGTFCSRHRSPVSYPTSAWGRTVLQNTVWSRWLRYWQRSCADPRSAFRCFARCA